MVHELDAKSRPCRLVSNANSLHYILIYLIFVTGLNKEISGSNEETSGSKFIGNSSITGTNRPLI